MCVLRRRRSARRGIEGDRLGSVGDAKARVWGRVSETTSGGQ